MFATRAADGAPLWAHDAGPLSDEPAAVGAGLVLVAARAGAALLALDAADGAPAWEVAAGGGGARGDGDFRWHAPPCVDEARGAAFAPREDGHVYALETRDGRVRWRLGFGCPLERSVYVAATRLPRQGKR